MSVCRVYSKNFINKHCTFTINGLANYRALCDNNSDTYATLYFEEANTPQELRIDFKDNYGEETIRKLNTLIFEKTTATNFDFFYVDALDEVIFLDNYDLTGNDIISLSQEIDAKGIILKFHHEEETSINIGELRALFFYAEIKALTEPKISLRARGDQITTLDGATSAWVDYAKNDISLNIKNASYDTFNLFLTRARTSEPITLLPLEGFIFYCSEFFINLELSGAIDRRAGVVDFTLALTEV